MNRCEYAALTSHPASVCACLMCASRKAHEETFQLSENADSSISTLFFCGKEALKKRNSKDEIIVFSVDKSLSGCAFCYEVNVKI